jgi:membrane protease YdiL (CAAX protease family)
MAEDRHDNEGGSEAGPELPGPEPVAEIPGERPATPAEQPGETSAATSAPGDGLPERGETPPEHASDPRLAPPPAFAEGFAARPGLRWANEHAAPPRSAAPGPSPWPQPAAWPGGQWQPGSAPWQQSPQWPQWQQWPGLQPWAGRPPGQSWPPTSYPWGPPTPPYWPPTPPYWPPASPVAWPPSAPWAGAAAGGWAARSTYGDDTPAPVKGVEGPIWRAGIAAAAAGSPDSWPLGVVPWGFSKSPPVPIVLEPPGRFHPPSLVRPILSIAGRASPRRYLMGLALGLPAGLALLAYDVASSSGFRFGSTSIAPTVLLELVSLVAALGLIAAAMAQTEQRRADGWRDFVGPSPFLLLAAQQASVFAVGLPVAALLRSANITTDSAMGLAAVVPVYLLTYFGLVHLLGVRPGAMTWRDIVHPRRLAPDPTEWTAAHLPARSAWQPQTSRLRRWMRGGLGDFLLAACFLIPVTMASGITNFTLLTVLGLHQTDLQSEVPMARTIVDNVIVFVAVAICIPIGEEVFFRGYVTNAWARSLGWNSALLRAGLFFAFVHVVNTDNADVWTALRAAAFNFGARIPVALALCWIYMRRRSLVASISLHGLFNGLIVLLAI